MLSLRKLIGIAVVMVIIPLQSFAHQQKAAITTVLFNPRRQNIEVMHRFNLHDAEHAVKRLFDKQADILKSEATQQKFARYVAERFSLKTQQGDNLPLTLLGTELDGKHVWIYQETPEPQSLDNLMISHQALLDIWQDQINTVNVEGRGSVKTLTFDDNVELLTVEFSKQ